MGHVGCCLKVVTVTVPSASSLLLLSVDMMIYCFHIVDVCNRLAALGDLYVYTHSITGPFSE